MCKDVSKNYYNCSIEKYFHFQFLPLKKLITLFSGYLTAFPMFTFGIPAMWLMVDSDTCSLSAS